jgi:hypothetical protein
MNILKIGICKTFLGKRLDQKKTFLGKRLDQKKTFLGKRLVKNFSK